MKITSIKNKLNKLNIKTEINVRPMMTRGDDVRVRGYVVELNATNGLSDVHITSHVSNDEIDFSNVLVESDIADLAIALATTDNIPVKSSHDESDSMTDYCAYTFFRNIKSLERIFA